MVRNYARDEGWPLEAGLQEQASNHLKLHRLRSLLSKNRRNERRDQVGWLKPGGNFAKNKKVMADSVAFAAAAKK